MIENTDFACIINREYKASSNKTYLTFKEIKARSKKQGNNLRYFAHPLAPNGIRLLEDFYKKQHISLLSLSQDQSLDTENIMNARRGNSSGRKQTRVERPDQASDVMSDFVIEE